MMLAVGSGRKTSTICGETRPPMGLTLGIQHHKLIAFSPYFLGSQAYAILELASNESQVA